MNLCLQKGHKFESAWCSPWQLEHLKVCGHGSPFFVFRHRGLIFVLALQHQPNLQWFSDLWGLLYLMHLESWILHKNIEWPYFQQFLRCSTPGFMLASLMVTIYFLTLKYWLIRLLVLLPLWISQILIQMIDMLDLGDILITCSLEAKVMLSKIWFCLMMVSTSLGLRQSCVTTLDLAQVTT